MTATASRKRWTPTEDEEVVCLLADGRSFSWVGEHLGRSRSAIVGKARMLRFRVDRMVRLRCQDVFEKWAANLDGQIWAREFDVIGYAIPIKGGRGFLVKGRKRGKSDRVSRFSVERLVVLDARSVKATAIRWTCALDGVEIDD